MTNQIYSICRIILLTFLAITLQFCKKADTAELQIKNEQTMNQSNLGHITLINSFEVPPDKINESVKYWEACRDFLKEQPGYVSTKLHQSIKDDARFQLVNVALWESPKAFMDATNKMRMELKAPPVEGLRPNASLYNVIRE